MFHSHHRRHRERNMLWPSSIGWKDVVVSSNEQCVSGVLGNKLNGDICAFVIMCPMSFWTASITFSLVSQFHQLLTTTALWQSDERTRNLSLPLLSPFSFPKERQARTFACTSCALTSGSLSYVSARRAIASSSAASKIEASSRVTYEENMSYFLQCSQSRASSTISLPGLTES